MRLLEWREDGEICFRDFQDDGNIPRYAILSHTWVEGQEVTFDDLMAGSGKEKYGHDKIRFCGEQARQDGLQYFWVDTCCINKANYAELSHSINSMFRWYYNAARCYVHLSDLSLPSFDSNDECDPQLWESDFQKCVWFTRGWTLQELLAPCSVEFFSREFMRIGDKRSLEHQIYEITGISKLALQGARLSQFGKAERFTWTQRRQTKLEEDRAYSLLGIFGLSIPIRYDEGIVNAFKRLEEEIDKLNKCLQDLRLTDPRDDKKRIEDRNGSLLTDSYRWILGNSYFQDWRYDKQRQLLWINGDPDKGKAMMLCGIVDGLNKSTAGTALISYFFCQAADFQTDNATAVLRGLIYMLISQQPSLAPYVQERYDQAGKMLFEDVNAWVALSEIFTNIIKDSSLDSMYFIIDALDECITAELPKLLAFIVQTLSISPRIRWIVSSRYVTEIERGLRLHESRTRLVLDLEKNTVHLVREDESEFQISNTPNSGGHTQFRSPPSSKGLDNSRINDPTHANSVVDRSQRREKQSPLPPQQPQKSSFLRQVFRKVSSGYKIKPAKTKDAKKSPSAIVSPPHKSKFSTNVEESTETRATSSPRDTALVDEGLPAYRKHDNDKTPSRSLSIVLQNSASPSKTKELQKLTLRQLQQLEPDYRVSAIAFSRDGRLATDSGSTISIWEADRQGWFYLTQKLEYSRRSEFRNPMAFSCDGCLAISDDRMGVLVWETDPRGRLQQAPKLEVAEIVTSIVFSPDGHQLATGGGNPVKIWEKDLQGRLQQVQRLKSQFVHSLAFSPDGRRLAAGGDSSGVLVWEVDQQGRFRQVQQVNETYKVTIVAFSPEGRLMTCGQGKVLIWQADRQGLLRVVQKLQVVQRIAKSVDFSLDGHLAIAQEGKKGSVLIFEADRQGRLRQVQELIQRRSSVAFSPDGRLATIAAPGKVLLWEAGVPLP